MTAGELEKTLEIRTSTILHSIRDLIENNLVNKTARGYSLTNVGRMQALMLDELVKTIITLNAYRDFWLIHDLSGIPDELQMKIWMLADSKIVTADSIALMHSVENFIKELIKSKEVHGVSPVIAPGYSDAINIAIKNGAKVNLILTGSLLDRISDDHNSMLKELLADESFRLYRIDSDVKVAFTVTDSLLALGLFRQNGDYDLGNDLICEGELAREWGKDLFDYYLSRSRAIKTI